MSGRPARKKGRNGNKKHGRNAAWCKAYRARGQREKNKATRLRRHLARHPGDRCAFHCLNNLGV